MECIQLNVKQYFVGAFKGTSIMGAAKIMVREFHFTTYQIANKINFEALMGGTR